MTKKKQITQKKKAAKTYLDMVKESITLYGTKRVSDRDLITTILGNEEVSKILLQKVDYDISQLSKMTVYEIINDPDISGKGVSIGKASALLAALELGKRMLRKNKIFVSGTSPQEVADYFMEEMSSYDQEHFKVLLLDSKLKIFKEEEISIGTVNASLVHPREVFSKAIRQHAVSIILVHNHPSGDPYPSMEDQAITGRLKEAGELLGITVVDHIIIGQKDYISFQEVGLM